LRQQFTKNARDNKYLSLKKKNRFSNSLSKGNLTYLSIGSNLGYREANLENAGSSIMQRIGPQVSASGIYETVPWGYESKHLFYNCCIGLLTEMEPLPMMDEILSIEREMGRRRETGRRREMGRQRGGGGYSDRIIDIDILFYGSLIVNHSRLIIPHPALEQRRFVLVPLHEIAPELIHPATGATVKTMLDRCTDHSRVVRVGHGPFREAGS
jgi:2-amino-4-hydroxy-6-hydroxymethyldihydropteridine diphosphokinase